MNKVLILILSVLFTIVLKIKTDTFTLVLVIFGVLFATIFDTSKKQSIFIYLLMALGLSFQITLDQHVVVTLISMALGLGVGYVLMKYLDKVNISTNINLIIICFILPFVILIGLMVIGKNINGTKAWLAIGSNTFQVTELIKICTILFLYSLYENVLLSDKQKSVISFIYMMGLSACFILINEIGTLALLWICYLCFVCMAFNIENIIRIGLTLAFFAALGGFIIYQMINLQDVPSNALLAKLFYISHKIMNRIQIASQSIDTLDRYNSGYQAYQSYKSLALSNLFSSYEKVSIPAGTTDYAFVLYTQLFGSIYSIVFMGGALALGIVSINEDNILVNLSIILLLSHIMLSVLGCFNMIPLSGIGTPFLSIGGSMSLVTMTLAYFIMNKQEEDYEK